MDGDPPVAELVPGAFDDDGAVIRHVTGGLALFGEVGERVVCGPAVESDAGQQLAGLIGRASLQLARERTERATELDGSSWWVAVPERQLAGLPRRRRDDHAVMSDVLYPP